MKNGCLNEQILQELLEGTMDRANAGTARRHLEGCAACAARYKTTKVLFTKLNQIPRIKAPAGFTRQIMGRLPVRLHFGVIDWRRYIAAGTALLMASFFFLLLGLSPYFAGFPLSLSREGSAVMHRIVSLLTHVWDTGSMILGKMSLISSSAGKMFLGAGWQVGFFFLITYILMGALCLWMIWNYSTKKQSRPGTEIT